MISITNKMKSGFLYLVGAAAILASCNKDFDSIPGNENVIPGGLTLSGTLAATPDDSLFNRMVIRGGLTTFLNNPATGYTLFVADNNTMKAFINAASGGAVPLTAPNSVFSTFISNSLSAATATNIVNYYTIPQKFTRSQIVHPFPNLELPTSIIAVPGNPLARLRAYVSKNPSTGIYYFNNIPLTGNEMIVGNSVIQHIAALIPPPQRMVWERINTDADLTIFKAAIQRADSGVAVSSPSSLIGNLQNFGANFTVLAPTNAAMKATISALTGGLLPAAAPDALFIQFLGSASITTLTVKGLAVYHFPAKRGAPATGTTDSSVAPIRIFSVNIPNTPITARTLLNSPGPGYAHPGLIFQATFTGPSASAFTVKGLANTTASNALINPTPDAAASYGATPPTVPVVYTGTSDQNYINGVLHKIDQVLRPL